MKVKAAPVVGASRGVGSVIVRELGMSGYHVAVMTTRDEAFYPESTKILLEVGVSYAWYASDIGKSEGRNRIVRETAERFEEIHVLVNNAGMASRVRADLPEMIEENSDYVIGTNIKRNMLVIQAAAW